MLPGRGGTSLDERAATFPDDSRRFTPQLLEEIPATCKRAPAFAHTRVDVASLGSARRSNSRLRLEQFLELLGQDRLDQVLVEACID